MCARAQQIIRHILSAGYEKVLLVGHHRINKTVIAVLTGMSTSEIEDVTNMKNTSLSVYKVTSIGDAEVFMFDSVAHLE